MADINASAGGTLNQDPFSVNMADGVGQGREPEISPTAADDDLNKDADKLDFLNDTDHSMMPNDTNLIQSMQEMMTENDYGDHEFRGDFHSAQQSLESAYNEIAFLNKYKRKILAVGINTTDIMALESKYPGMLVKPGNGFTLESNDSNKEASLEAINEAISFAVKKLEQGIEKFLNWLIKRTATIYENFQKFDLRKKIARIQQRATAGQSRFYTVAELEAKIGENANQWNRSQVVTSYGSLLGIEITLDRFKGVRNANDYKEWLRAIMSLGPNLKGTVADNNTITTYGFGIKKLGHDLKNIKLDSNLESLISSLDKRILDLAATNPFDHEKEADLGELYLMGMKDYDSYAVGLTKSVNESLTTLKSNLKGIKAEGNVDEDSLKGYIELFNDIGQCINELLKDFTRNHRIVAQTYSFVDFATWSCDKANGLVNGLPKLAA